MSRSPRFAPLLLFVFGAELVGQTASQQIRGVVMMRSAAGERPAEAVEVLALETGGRTITKDEGLFILRLPAKYQAGDTVTLRARVEGWEIYDPVGGKLTVPRYADRDLQRLELRQRGSRDFLGDSRLLALVESGIDSFRNTLDRLAQEPGRDAKFDLTPVLRDWAQHYGFGLAEVRREVDRWAREVDERATAGARERAAAAFALKSFARAGDLYSESARLGRERLEETGRRRTAILAEERRRRRDAASDFGRAGDAYSAADRFEDAISAYTEALSLLDRHSWPEAWAWINISLGNANAEAAKRAGFKQAGFYLGQAEAAYRESLAATNESLPKARGAALNNLGNTLKERALRSRTADAAQLLDRAVQIHYLALKVRTREEMPEDWATTQNNLGVAIVEQARRAEPDDAAELLDRAVDAYSSALEIRTRHRMPHEWAATQHNFSSALTMQAQRSKATEALQSLAQAIEAYREALEIRTRDEMPQEWAATQHGFGVALLELARRSDRNKAARLLDQAAKAHRSALDVLIRDGTRQERAAALNDFGVVLREQALRSAPAEATQLLAQAVEAYHAALAIRTRNRAPQDWAMTENNLGVALLVLAQRSDSRSNPDEARSLLSQSAEHLANALEVRTRERSPAHWATGTANLAAVYEGLGRWAEAARLYEQVLQLQPANAFVLGRVALIHRDHLFQFERAFDFAAQGFAGNPEDPAALAEFATAQFTTARFEECLARVKAAEAPGLSPPSLRPYLDALASAALLALNQREAARRRLAFAAVLARSLPDDFIFEQSFQGARLFVSYRPEFAAHRDVLEDLFGSLERATRDEVGDAFERVAERLRLRPRAGRRARLGSRSLAPSAPSSSAWGGGRRW